LIRLDHERPYDAGPAGELRMVSLTPPGDLPLLTRTITHLKELAMPRFVAPSFDELPQASQEALAGLRDPSGRVLNYYATLGLSPAALKGLFALSGELTQGELSPREQNLIQLVVSQTNGCPYCIGFFVGTAAAAGASPEATTAARRGAGSNPREQAILDLARKVARTGGSGCDAEVRLARAAGLSSSAILEILAWVALTAYENMVGLVTQAEVDVPLPADAPRYG
jgi:uncharacterized peroxidase-related enzyme